VVVDVLDRNFVVVSGPRVKRRRCNVMHLEPTDKKLDIPRGCSDEDVRRALEALG
jgi:large subunit ribosomal protein L14e